MSNFFDERVSMPADSDCLFTLCDYTPLTNFLFFQKPVLEAHCNLHSHPGH